MKYLFKYCRTGGSFESKNAYENLCRTGNAVRIRNIWSRWPYCACKQMATPNELGAFPRCDCSHRNHLNFLFRISLALKLLYKTTGGINLSEKTKSIIVTVIVFLVSIGFFWGAHVVYKISNDPANQMNAGAVFFAFGLTVIGIVFLVISIFMFIAICEAKN